MRRTTTAFLMSFLLLSFAAEAPAAWKIELVSGRTLEANSCRVENGRIFLEYPIGEASFPLSEVKSVLQDDRKVEMFQEKGTPQAKKCPADGDISGQPYGSPAAPAAGGPAPASQSGPKPEPAPESLPETSINSVKDKRFQPGAGYDPEAEEIISGLDGADGARQAEFEKKMDELFKKDEDIQGN